MTSFAVELLARGIPEADPTHPVEALALAKDLDAWSSMLGLLGEPEAGLEKAERAWALRHYRDRLTAADLADPQLLNESRTALDELTRLLGLGALYDFQRA